jgi:methylated-DNA-[protein]-cysteine S-methyltransferase
MKDPSVKIDSPLGRLRIVVSDVGLAEIEFISDATAKSHQETPLEKPKDHILRQTLAWLDTYFQRMPAPHSEPPLDLQGTAFQLSVWRYLRTIPWGQTKSYGEIARAIGRPKAVRAVGGACGANPIAILIPCHRVLSAGSGLGGYSAGLERKRWLLAHEGNHQTKT